MKVNDGVKAGEQKKANMEKKKNLLHLGMHPKEPHKLKYAKMQKGGRTCDGKAAGRSTTGCKKGDGKKGDSKGKKEYGTVAPLEEGKSQTDRVVAHWPDGYRALLSVTYEDIDPVFNDAAAARLAPPKKRKAIRRKHCSRTRTAKADPLRFVSEPTAERSRTLACT